MARSKDNIFTQGLSGAVGGMMLFRTWNGKTYVYKKAKNPSKQSAKQKENRSRFRMATAFAKRMMKDPVMKAEYLEKAKKLLLPNAYTAAITEYMRKPEVRDIDTSNYSGLPDEVITMNVVKKDFEVEMVEVVVVDKDGRIVEEGKAVKGFGSGWSYKTTALVEDMQAAQLIIRVRERTGNYIDKKVLISEL